MGLQEVTGDTKGFQRVPRGYGLLQGVSKKYRGNNRLLGVTRCYRGYQGVTGSYKIGYRRLQRVIRGLQGLTRGYKRLERVTRGYSGLQGLEEVTRC